MVIALQKGIIYGPVNSRRLGCSLGINLLSSKIKVCSFDCVYCQYGYTKIDQSDFSNKKLYPKTIEIIEDLKEAVEYYSVQPAYITFSGNGEATLHPEFAKIVESVIALRDRFSPESKTAILSNSTTVNDPKIIEVLSYLDVKIMKLDCGLEDVYQKYNQPVVSIRLEDIVDGLKKIPNVTIQTLFAGGEEGNFENKYIDAWIEKIMEIKPTDVQIYSLDRGYPSMNIYPVEIDELIKVKNRLIDKGIKAEVY